MKLSLVSDIVNVDLGDRKYPIYIGQGLLNNGNELLKHIKSKKVLIVTNTKVGPLYLSIVKKCLEGNGIQVYDVILPDGEEYKTMDTLNIIMDVCMDAKLDRKSTLIALGGGVIGDMTGFAAAIYQRGVKFIQIPTTLMAMVDSAVGGKTAVNHPKGKNMIGAFYQPDAVIVDTDTLKTLPDRELKSGIAEVIKYGLIRDPDFFLWQEQNVEKIIARDPAALAYTIKRSCENKAEVVVADEKEGGVRATLNLGHTFGHAIETGLGYGAWLHGEAVATGMIMAAEMSHAIGYIDEDILTRTRLLTLKAGLPTTLRNAAAEVAVGIDNHNKLVDELSSEKFLDLMSVDKKVADGQLSLVLLKGSLGTSIITDKFNPVDLQKIVSSYCSK